MPNSQECRAKAAIYLQQAEETSDPRYKGLLRRLAVDVLSLANQMDGVDSLLDRQRLQVRNRTDIDRPAAFL